eukprot:513137-Rhodomonas_salina.1
MGMLHSDAAGQRRTWRSWRLSSVQWRSVRSVCSALFDPISFHFTLDSKLSRSTSRSIQSYLVPVLTLDSNLSRSSSLLIEPMIEPTSFNPPSLSTSHSRPFTALDLD